MLQHFDIKNHSNGTKPILLYSIHNSSGACPEVGILLYTYQETITTQKSLIIPQITIRNHIQTHIDALVMTYSIM